MLECTYLQWLVVTPAITVATGPPGVKLAGLPVPACSAFLPRLLGDQLCYTIDVNQFLLTPNNRFYALEKGLIFVMDYNPERMTMKMPNKTKMGPLSLYNFYDRTAENKEAKIVIETIGKIYS